MLAVFGGQLLERLGQLRLDPLKLSEELGFACLGALLRLSEGGRLGGAGRAQMLGVALHLGLFVRQASLLRLGGFEGAAQLFHASAHLLLQSLGTGHRGLGGFAGAIDIRGPVSGLGEFSSVQRFAIGLEGGALPVELIPQGVAIGLKSSSLGAQLEDCAVALIDSTASVSRRD